jgi:Tfp pilus assembly protein PilX
VKRSHETKALVAGATTITVAALSAGTSLAVGLMALCVATLMALTAAVVLTRRN